MKLTRTGFALALLATTAASWAQHAGHGQQPTAPHASSGQHGSAHHGPGHAGASAAPYAGMEKREIKALSAEETQRLLQGQGMSLALAAELNGYPGPMHVLEHAEALKLTQGQRQQTESLMQRHKAQARELGAKVVEAERSLDAAFARGGITAEEVMQHTRRIGELQSALRASHLQTHLAQTALLSREQVAQYQQLRGYSQGGAR